MNFRRGFMRLWLVGAVLWTVVAFLFGMAAYWDILPKYTAVQKLDGSGAVIAEMTYLEALGFYTSDELSAAAGRGEIRLVSTAPEERLAALLTKPPYPWALLLIWFVPIAVAYVLIRAAIWIALGFQQGA